MPNRAEFLSGLETILGERGLVPADAHAPHLTDWRKLFTGRALAVARPATTAEVSAVVALAARHGVAVVPQGGNTGMAAGAVPTEDGGELVLSLSRLNRIRELDPVDMTLTVDAGVTLKAAQDAASAQDCKLPLSIGAEGTAQIGGIVATNAGGNNTLRYGNARDLLLGLEVVLPNGDVWNGLRRLRKDNAGYCLRHLFAGSEGTLGVITGAVLQLVPAPVSQAVALCALPSVEAALALYALFRRHDATAIQAFEYMSGTSMDMVLTHIPRTSLPLATPARHYVLVELATTRSKADLRSEIESVLESAIAAEIVLDAVVAQSGSQRDAMWKLREEHAEAQRRAGASVKNDVSVPLSRIPELLHRGSKASAAVLSGIRVAPFGHMGDGNIHLNISQPAGGDKQAFLARWNEVNEIVFKIVLELGGTISAEHGIGVLKRALLREVKSPLELRMMEAIKRSLDPAGIMNPGKVL